MTSPRQNKTIGSGGYGVVVSALDKKKDTKVAVKKVCCCKDLEIHWMRISEVPFDPEIPGGDKRQGRNAVEAAMCFAQRRSCKRVHRVYMCFPF